MKVDGPVEVWLSQKNMQVTCTVVHEDEHTEELAVDSLSMRGAEREITGWLIGQGFTPVGRWQSEYDTGPVSRGDYEAEVSRRFVPAKAGE